jgi:perosamine synthetase
MKVPQFMPYLDLQEWEATKECFEDNWITEGPKSKLFSEKLCEMIGCKYGVFAANGTLALYLGLKAIGIGPGDEVIVPDFTFIASANAVEMVGATPVFCDIGEDLQIDIADCIKLLSSRTKAIMPVHIYGFAANMEEVMTFAKENNLLVIEDAAQALGIKWNGKGCGSYGDVATFSFFADKTVTTGEGGFVCTNNEKTYENLLFLRNQGRINRGSFIHPRIGYNFRMTDIQASIGLKQLDKFEDIVSKKQNNFSLYVDLLKDVDGIEILLPKPEVSPFIPFRVVAKLTNGEKSESLMEFMKSKDIETRTFFYPLHKQPCFQQIIKKQKYKFWRTYSSCKRSAHAYDTGVCLPSYASLSREQIEYVCNTIKEYFEGRQK